MKRTSSINQESNKRQKTEGVNNTQLPTPERARSPETRTNREMQLEIRTNLNNREIDSIEESYHPVLEIDLCKEILRYLNFKNLMLLRFVSQKLRDIVDTSNHICLKNLVIDHLLNPLENFIVFNNHLPIKICITGCNNTEIQTIIQFIKNPSNESILKRIECFVFYVNERNLEKVLELLNLFTEKIEKLPRLTTINFNSFDCSKKTVTIPAFPTTITSIDCRSMTLDNLIFTELPNNLNSMNFEFLNCTNYGNNSDPCIQISSFPESLRRLVMPTSYTKSPVQFPELPRALEYFGIGHIEDTSFQCPILPENVTTLQLENLRLIKQYNLEELPQNIKSLRVQRIGQLGSQGALTIVTSESFPNTLNNFYFDGTPIGTIIFSSLPDNLNSFSIGFIKNGATIGVQTFPTQLRSFHIEFIDEHSMLLLPKTISENLESVTFGEVKNPVTKQMIEDIQRQIEEKNNNVH